MAINTIMFSQYANKAALLAGLKTIIDGYEFFDTTNIDETNGTLTCNVGDFCAMKVITDSSSIVITKIQFWSTNNCSSSYIKGGSWTNEYINKIILTSKAIYFGCTNHASDYCAIGKTSNGELGVVYGAGGNTQCLNVFSTVATNSAVDITPKRIDNSNVTTLSPLPIVNGGDIMQDMYVIIACENTAAGNYTLNGTNYYSDGYVMLAD